MARQLVNTSWTLHRLTPLHHDKEFQDLVHDPIALKTHADRLQDYLNGGIIGGYPMVTATGADAEDSALSKGGVLKRCTWQTISAQSSSGQGLESGRSEDRDDDAMGILVILEYEFITYKAALLAPPVDEEQPERVERTTSGERSRRKPITANRKQGSTHLPLLLTRLPNTLRQNFISFLSANFDAYCTLLQLPSDFLCSGLDMYLKAIVTDSDRESPLSTTRSIELLEDLIKEIHLTLAFSPSVAPSLRMLDIGIPRENLIHFIGLEINESGGATDQSDHVVRDSFLKGINSYLEKHLAMKLDLMDSSSAATTTAGYSPAKRHVRLAKIACGAFVLGAEGKLKLLPASPDAAAAVGDEAVRGRKDSGGLIMKASKDLLRALINRAIIGQ